MKKSKSRHNPWITKLFFVLPILIIVILVVYAYVNLNSPGILMIRAQTSSGAQLQVTAIVNGMSGETPWTLTLGQGTYAVTFPTIQWYYPPPSRDVTLESGQTEYAVTVYQPIAKVIAVTSSGFNSTTVTALHGTTPVVWINYGSTPAVFSGPLLGQTIIQAGQNHTYTFTTPGTYTYMALDTNGTVTVVVQ
jgi:plastocyanin